VTARLIESNDRIRSGMVAETTVGFTRQRPGDAPRMVVPAVSVAEDSRGRFAYVAIPLAEPASETQPEAGMPPRSDANTEPSSDPFAGGLATIERREVTIGDLSIEGLEITEGLEVGDRVVIAGLRFVEPGMTVRMLTR
jgi:hypothetical protein